MTAGWALWAYAWLLLVYEFWTPGEVTPMEAWLTLLMFPMLVASAYKMEGRHVQDSKAEEDDGLDQVRSAGQQRPLHVCSVLCLPGPAL